MGQSLFSSAQSVELDWDEWECWGTQCTTSAALQGTERPFYLHSDY